MALYLLDTNIVLRLANADDVQHALVSEAVVRILAQEQE
jgi:predicted nucleic acid-binding protein